MHSFQYIYHIYCVNKPLSNCGILKSKTLIEITASARVLQNKSRENFSVLMITFQDLVAKKW